jgi:tRNA dimethylallyltransferase
VIIITGPTGTGKSELAVRLAERLGGEIISADSVQIYQKVNIGAAKPTVAERRGVPHHLLDELDLRAEFTAAMFGKRARALAGAITARGKVPLVVGGTGLYLRALTDDFDFAVAMGTEVRERLSRRAADLGMAAMYAELVQVDPGTAEQLAPSDTVRVLHALAVWERTGRPYSQQRAYRERAYPDLPEGMQYYALTAPRPWLYERLNRRAAGMLEGGLIAETRQILAEGYEPSLKPLQSIGYRHALWHLQGLLTMAETERLLARDTRHFAKRQWTWFRRDPRLTWFDVSEHSLAEIAATISGFA